MRQVLFRFFRRPYGQDRVVSLSFFILFFVMVVAIRSFGKEVKKTEDHVCFDRNCFIVELAQTDEEHTKGLQNRDAMPQDHGMLFIFTRAAKYNFWMKDTKIPLDIIWLDYKRQVVSIRENLSPCLQAECPTYPPDVAALYVLELNAGQARRVGLKLGDEARFELKD